MSGLEKKSYWWNIQPEPQPPDWIVQDVIKHIKAIK